MDESDNGGNEEKTGYDIYGSYQTGRKRGSNRRHQTPANLIPPTSKVANYGCGCVVSDLTKKTVK